MSCLSPIRCVRPVVHDEPPDDAIGRAEVGKWVAWQEKQKTGRPGGEGLISPKTVRNYHALLSSMLTAAVDQIDTVTSNAAHKTRLSSGRRHEAVFLSPADFRTIVAFMPDRYARLAWFLAGTGTRWGEATALTWGDVNLRNSPATVRIDKAWKRATGGSLLKHPKTSRSNRTISLWPDLVERLGEPGPSGQLLFPSTVGNRVWPGRFRDSGWVPAIEAAMDAERCGELGLDPIPKHPRINDLRHSHASWLMTRRRSRQPEGDLMLYNITADIAAHEDAGVQLIDALEGYHPAIAHIPGRATIVMSLPAESLTQAVRTGLAVLQANVPHELLSIEVMSSDDFDRREGFEVLPELASISDAAEMLGTSRQAVQQQVDRGRFVTARKVGPAWVIARAEVEKRLADQPTAAARTTHVGPASVPRDDWNPMTVGL